MRFLKAFFFVLVILIFCITISVFAEDNEETTCITNKTTVIGAAVALNNRETAVNTPLIELSKSSADLSVLVKLLYVDNEGHLSFEGRNGESNKLVDANRAPIPLVNGLRVDIVYDDCSGLARFYINKKAAYCLLSSSELVHRVRVGEDFFNLASDDDNLYVSDVLDSVSVKNDSGEGTAQIIALQEHLYEDKIRLLAGVDMLWFEEVGFELTVYENGELINEKYVSSGVAYTEIMAVNKQINAEQYGFDYFVAFEISDMDIKNDEYYIVVRPYSENGGSRAFGEPVGIIADSKEVSFDENFKTKDLGGEGAVSVSLNCRKEIYVTLSSPKDAVIDVYVNDVKTNSVEIEKGRTNVWLTSVENGMNQIKLECDGDCTVKFFTLNYFALPCEHTVDVSSVWAITDEGYTAKCFGCGDTVVFAEAAVPSFLLTFDNSVAAEASQYSGFSVVSPSGFSIGNDTDGDKALTAGEKTFYIDVEQETLANMPYYAISFDLTVTKQGMSDSNISLLTLISNYRDGAKKPDKKADHAYFFKYNANSKTLSTIDIDVDDRLLNAGNSISIELNKQYKITIIVDTKNCLARVFVDGTCIGISEKTLVDVMGKEEVYPSFCFNGGGACYPVYDNFKIVQIK